MVSGFGRSAVVAVLTDAGLLLAIAGVLQAVLQLPTASPGYGVVGAFAVTFSYCMVLGYAGILAVSHHTAYRRLAG